MNTPKKFKVVAHLGKVKFQWQRTCDEYDIKKFVRLITNVGFYRRFKNVTCFYPAHRIDRVDFTVIA